ncbi:MAG TPA: 50S ribosomal protein L22 [Chlamydiales bacterium]|nr:50S ribosomal protein L22 [Chlamydiales bacterium]
MSSYQAVTKYVRISPRKARYAADLVRGMPVVEARRQLEACGMKGGRLLLKTLDSAVANAEMQGDTSREKLKVEAIFVNEGPRLKRAKPRSKGSSHPILKRMSHFTVIVGE